MPCAVALVENFHERVERGSALAQQKPTIRPPSRITHTYASADTRAAVFLLVEAEHVWHLRAVASQPRYADCAPWSIGRAWSRHLGVDLELEHGGAPLKSADTKPATPAVGGQPR